MVSLSLGLDTRHISQLRLRRGLTPGQLERKAKIGRDYVIRLEKGKIPSTVPLDIAFRLCHALDVPLEAICPACGSRWTPLEWTNVRQIDEFLSEVESAHHVLTVTKGLDGYLTLGPAMDAYEKTRLQAMGWTLHQIEERLQTLRSYELTQLQRRISRNYIQRILCQESLFYDFISAEPSWPDLCIKRLREELNGETILGLVPHSEWQTLDNSLRRSFSEWSTWDKVHIIDDVLALFRPTGEFFMFTYHRPTIMQMKHQIEKLAPLVPYCFPTEKEINIGSLASNNGRTFARIKEVARRVHLRA